ncbi:MAG: cyclic nucleotide-binding protein [Acidimicrobiales bacterium]|nr:cyclic nucleotide-binding protein [Acidimicrobiales bacterium]
MNHLLSGPAAVGPAAPAAPIEPTSVETPDVSGAYPRLHEDETRTVARYGRRRRVGAGEPLFREGDAACDFFVILDGLVALTAGRDDDRRTLGLHGPRRFLGELSLRPGRRASVSAVARTGCDVLVVPIERLRDLMATDPVIGDTILRAYLIRRSILIGLGSGFKIVGSHHSASSGRLREFAARNRLPHRWIDLEHDAESEALLRRLEVAPADVPIVFWRGELMRNPRTDDLARTIGLRARPAARATCDMLVVGGGPAGLAAAVYGASAGLSTITLDPGVPGGQAGRSPRIEGYLGFPSGISGAELAERATTQAQRFGAQIMAPARAAALDRVDGQHRVRLEDGNEVTGRTVLIATGARYRRLDARHLDVFERTSVHYAATPVEAQRCGTDPVAVVGGGSSAALASLFLAGRGAEVRLLVRGDELGAGMSRYLADRIRRADRITVLLRTVVRELVGQHHSLRTLVVEDRGTGEEREVPAHSLFVFIGAEPHAAWLGNEVARDEHGFVITGCAPGLGRSVDRSPDASWRPGPLETSRRGVFAVGDVRSGSVKRVAAAVGEGAMAARLVHDHLEQHWGGTSG